MIFVSAISDEMLSSTAFYLGLCCLLFAELPIISSLGYNLSTELLLTGFFKYQETLKGEYEKKSMTRIRRAKHDLD